MIIFDLFHEHDETDMPSLLAPDEVQSHPNEEAEKWHPTEAGEALVGRLEAVVEREVSWGRCDVAFIRARAGKLWAVFLSRAVLVGLFQEKRPHHGQRLAIIYDGSRKSENNRYYHVYELELQKETIPRVRAAHRGDTGDEREEAVA